MNKQYASLHIALSSYISVESPRSKFPGEFIYNLSHSLDKQWTIWRQKKTCLHKTLIEYQTQPPKQQRVQRLFTVKTKGWFTIKTKTIGQHSLFKQLWNKGPMWRLSFNYFTNKLNTFCTDIRVPVWTSQVLPSAMACTCIIMKENTKWNEFLRSTELVYCKKMWITLLCSYDHISIISSLFLQSHW